MHGRVIDGETYLSRVERSRVVVRGDLWTLDEMRVVDAAAWALHGRVEVAGVAEDRGRVAGL